MMRKLLQLLLKLLELLSGRWSYSKFLEHLQHAGQEIIHEEEHGSDLHFCQGHYTIRWTKQHTVSVTLQMYFVTPHGTYQELTANREYARHRFSKEASQWIQSQAELVIPVQ